MSDFFNSDDVLIVIDDDICPKSEEFMFVELPENIVTNIANELDYIESEYQTKTLGDIITELGDQEKLNNFFNYELPFDFNSPQCFKYHPNDLKSNNIHEEIKKHEGCRIFIILDRYLDVHNDDNLLKEYLEQIYIIMSKKPVALLLYTNNKSPITSLDDAKDFLENMQFKDDKAEKVEVLSMHINFIDKGEKVEEKKFEEVFRKSQNANLLNLYQESHKKAISALRNRMWDINNNEDLIHYDYLMEGMHIDDIFYQIYKKKFDFLYNEKCFKSYKYYINPVRKAIQSYETSKKIVSTTKMKKELLISRIIKEFNESLHSEGMILKCKKSDDISFGDLIRIEGDYYLVISQSCDIVIRKAHSRKFNTINLIKVKKSDEKLNADYFYSLIASIINTKQLNEKDKKLIRENKKAFQKLGLDEEKIEKILGNTENCIIKDNSIKQVELSNDNIIYTVNDIWLDSLLLRNNDSENIEISHDIINKSSELRFSTKDYISRSLESYIKNTKTLLKIH